MSASQNSSSNSRWAWTPWFRSLIESEVEAGTSIAEICRKHGVTHGRMRTEFPDYRVGQRGGYRQSTAALAVERFLAGEHFAAMKAMVEDGASLNEIMRTLGSDHRTIKKYFPDAGWTKEQGMERKRLEKRAYAVIKERWDK